MTFENENARFWEAETLAEYINRSKFKCDDDSKKDNILFENDEYNITTDNTSEIPLTLVTTINGNDCIHEFLFDHEAFKNVKEKVGLNEYNEDDITWDDMVSVEKDSEFKPAIIFIYEIGEGENEASRRINR